VRSESKGTYLKEKFGDNFEFAIVGGLEQLIMRTISHIGRRFR